jgi:predicted dithiol-disulfide oxidoreductase (DUF899 family)
MPAKRKQVSLHSERFPGESADYRNARDGLLEAEIELRRRLEDVAKLRRQLPPGGTVPQDYEFEEGAEDLDDKETIRRVKLLWRSLPSSASGLLRASAAGAICVSCLRRTIAITAITTARTRRIRNCPL